MLWPSLLLLVSFSQATLVLVGLAVSVSPRFLWPAVFTSWLGSFLGSWSIGLLTLVSTFVLLALAVGNSLGWLTSVFRVVIAISSGVLVWVALVYHVDDYWLFFPLNEILRLFFE